MRDMLLKLCVKTQILRDDNGQDLIEYALIAALLATAVTTTMTGVATAINGRFTAIAGLID